MGGGRSFGKQSDFMKRDAARPPAQSGQQATQQPPANGAAAGATGGRSWMGPIAGIAAGLGLAALASHLGLGEEFGTIILMALVFFAVLIAVRMFMARRNGGAIGRGAAVGLRGRRRGGDSGSDARGQADSNQPWAARTAGRCGCRLALGAAEGGRRAAGAAAAAPATVSAVTSSGDVPADFDVDRFIHGAKVYFVRLQAAFDNNRADDLREFTSPEMFAELSLDLMQRGKEQQTTDVVTLDARLLGVERTGDGGATELASVRFEGMLREAQRCRGRAVRRGVELHPPATAAAAGCWPASSRSAERSFEALNSRASRPAAAQEAAFQAGRARRRQPMTRVPLPLGAAGALGPQSCAAAATRRARRRCGPGGTPRSASSSPARSGRSIRTPASTTDGFLSLTDRRSAVRLSSPLSPTVDALFGVLGAGAARPGPAHQGRRRRDACGAARPGGAVAALGLRGGSQPGRRRRHRPSHRRGGARPAGPGGRPAAALARSVAARRGDRSAARWCPRRNWRCFAAEIATALRQREPAGSALRCERAAGRSSHGLHANRSNCSWIWPADIAGDQAALQQDPRLQRRDEAARDEAERIVAIGGLRLGIAHHRPAGHAARAHDDAAAAAGARPAPPASDPAACRCPIRR